MIKIIDVTNVPAYSRLKQGYVNFFQATLRMLLKLTSKFGANLSQTYKDMTLHSHMLQNMCCNLLQENCSIL